MPTGEEWDFIVIGAGSAGCAVADHLSEKGHRILVLEAGGSDRSPFLRVPAGTMRLGDRYKWLFPLEPDSSRDGRSDTWVGGKVIGGSSSINAMVWARGNQHDYDSWAAEGCEGWDFASVLPYFKRGETFEGGLSDLRGDSGPQFVSYSHIDHPLTELFIEAARNAGFPFNEDFNGHTQAGVGYGQVSQRRGLRSSSATAHLAPARRRKNVRVLTRAFARRVLFEGDAATGVEYTNRGSIRIARCRGEVILCLGAMQSPKLLLQSGIGPADQLTRLGINVQVDLPGVGENLQDHFGIAQYFEVDLKTLNRELTPMSVLRGSVDLILRGRGTATAALCHAVLFGSTDNKGVDYKAYFSPFGLSVREHSAGGAERHKLMNINVVTIRPTVLHPKARGRLTLRSMDPESFPVIQHEYAANSDDVKTLATICTRVRDVVNTEPMCSHVLRELQPGIEVQSQQDWDMTIRKLAYPGQHPGGTCKMGIDEMSVVDPQLRVRGAQQLRVIDMSIVPRLPTGNTNAPAIMIGERGADLILGRTLPKAPL